MNELSQEILDRLPPQNLEAEKGVLGSLLLDPDMCDEVALIVRAEDFYAEANQKLFDHVLAMHQDGGKIDHVLLSERLKREGDWEAIGGAAYLGEVAGSVPYAANAVYYAKIVRDKATLRSLIHASTEILRDAYDESVAPQAILSQSEQRIFSVSDARSTHKVTNAHDLMIEALDRIDARLDGSEGVAVQTGLIDLDRRTGGLHDSELIILAARPSVGKTSLALNIAEYVTIEGGVPMLFVSLEMARQEVANRMLCSQGRVDGSRFRGGFLSAQDRQQLAEASTKLAPAPFFIDDTANQTVTEVAACARRLKRNEKEQLGLVVIDYLQLIQPDDPKDSRQEQVAKMARRLKILARELKLPILCLSQLNRQVESSKDHRPRLSQLRESGAIEQDADVVIFIHREEMYLKTEDARFDEVRGVAELITAKQRSGPTGTDKVAWLDKYMRFENLAVDPQQEFGSWDGQF
jgi:replicative DNA helicase